jgi:uncharacterized protein (DUF58 family)
MMNKKLLDFNDYQLINQLSLAAKRRITGMATGEQRSPIQGGGIEFADYREYQAGDDIRRIDWSVFLRLHRLLVKLCAEEKELTLILILDNSRSMRFGEPDKLWLACRVAAVLAGIALHGGNRTGVLTVGSALNELLKPVRNRISLNNVIKAMEQIEPVQSFDPYSCIKQFSARYGGKCMFVFLSDLLYPEWSKVISGLAASGCEGYLVQLLAPEELDPPLLGEITLTDIEEKGEISLHIGFDEVRSYRRELAAFLKQIRQKCHQVGLGHIFLSTEIQLARIFHHDLRKGGLIC